MRRNPYIDDAAAAYIENRATEQDEATLRGRESREPQLRRDLDSIRQTVSLLRSIETVRAPRSFALAHAPAPLRHARKPRLVMAPAVFAVAAAVAVGLLAIGNYADVVRQSDGNTDSSSTQLSLPELSAATVVTEGIQGAEGPEGEAGLDPDTRTLSTGPSESARAAATSTPSAAQPTGTPAPLPTSDSSFAGSVPATEQAALPPSFSDEPTEPPGATTKDGEGALPPPEDSSLIRVVPEGDETTLGMTTESATTAATAEDAGGFGDTLQSLPQVTVTGSSVDNRADSSVLTAIEPQGQPGANAPEERKGGFAIPLWQLQVGFAALAVLMAGVWMLLQRRLTA